jgi:dolichol-phosphate mannosyltransferase
MNGSIFGEAFFGVMRLRWDGWFKKYPKPVDEKPVQKTIDDQI